MAPGANNRNTGTVPKQTKTRNNNVVPQEMVVPTRRDLQQLNVSKKWIFCLYLGSRGRHLIVNIVVNHMFEREIVYFVLFLFYFRFKNKLVICSWANNSFAAHSLYTLSHFSVQFLFERHCERIHVRLFDCTLNIILAFV